jgi:hypothetical protein
MAALPPPAEAAMAACLARLGFEPPAVALLQQHGLRTAATFKDISYPTMKAFTETMTKGNTYRPPVNPVGRPNAAAAAAAAVYQPPVMPFHAVNALKAFRAWIDFREVRGEPLDPNMFTDYVRPQWLMRIDILDSAIRHPPGNKPPPELKDFSGWLVWDRDFRTYIESFRSPMCGAPLSYVLRDHDVVTPEMLQKPVTDIDAALVETFSLDNIYVRADLIAVYDKLKPLVSGSNLFCHLKAIDALRDGRRAYKALKAQAEGPGELERRRTAAYQKLTTKFVSWSRRFTFDQYITLYQSAYNELEQLEDPQSELSKVNTFLQNITDTSFSTILVVLRGDSTIYDSFERTQQRIKQLYLQNYPDAEASRSVASIRTSGGRAPSHRGGGRGRGGRGGNRTNRVRPNRMNYGIKHYTKEEYDKLTPEQKTKLREDREAAKAKRGAPSAGRGGPSPGRGFARISSVSTINPDYQERIDAARLAEYAADDLILAEADAGLPKIEDSVFYVPRVDELKLSSKPAKDDPNLDPAVLAKATEKATKEHTKVFDRWVKDVNLYAESIEGRDPDRPVPKYPQQPSSLDTYIEWNVRVHNRDNYWKDRKNPPSNSTTMTSINEPIPKKAKACASYADVRAAIATTLKPAPRFFLGTKPTLPYPNDLKPYPTDIKPTSLPASPKPTSKPISTTALIPPASTAEAVKESGLPDPKTPAKAVKPLDAITKVSLNVVTTTETETKKETHPLIIEYNPDDPVVVVPFAESKIGDVTKLDGACGKPHRRGFRYNPDQNNYVSRQLTWDWLYSDESSVETDEDIVQPFVTGVRINVPPPKKKSRKTRKRS